MEFDSIRPWGGGHKKIVIRPSAENGMFIINGPEGASLVSDSLCLTGMTGQVISDIEGGNLESISEYLRQDPNEPSVTGQTISCIQLTVLALSANI